MQNDVIVITVVSAFALLISNLAVSLNLKDRIAKMNKQEETAFAALTAVATSLVDGVNSAVADIDSLTTKLASVTPADPDESAAIADVTAKLTTMRDNLTAKVQSANDDHEEATGEPIPTASQTGDTDATGASGDATSDGATS